MGLDSTKDGQAEDGSLQTDYNTKGLQNGPRDKGEVRPHSTHVHKVALPAMVTVSDNLELFLYQSYAVIPGEQNPYDIQVLQVLVHSSIPSLNRRGRGRPRPNRTVITIYNVASEVIKITEDEDSGERRVFKVQAEA